MNLSMLPDELKAYPQFVVWNYKNRDGGKPAKTPYSPLTGYRASVTAPSTWGTYEQAIAASSSYNGIGFVLTTNDPYAVIDLDDPEGNEAIRESQLSLVDYCNSYTELSPSGNGAHIWVKGSVPTGKRHGKFEVYSDSRYMTVTGVVHHNKPIEERQEELNNLWTQLSGIAAAGTGPEPESTEMESDATLFQRAVSAANGGNFSSLGGGTWQSKYRSQSDADFALLNMLCFYSASDSQVRRMFRATVLGQRDKAKRDDYLNLSIRKIRAEKLPAVDLSKIIQKGYKHALPSHICTFNGDELLSRSFAPVQWAIHGLIPAGVSLLVGAPKLGKSWLCLQAAIAIAGAAPLWTGRESETQGDVLALCLEDNARRLHGRLQRLLPGMIQTEFMAGIRTPSVQRLHFATEWPRADEGGILHLDSWLTARPETRLVLIDTLARFRSQDDARTPPYQRDTNAIAQLQALANRHGCAVVVVHHTRKDNNGDALDSISGTNGLSGAADASLILTRVRGQAEAALFITGRDVEETTLALRFDHSLCLWSSVENPADILLGAERREVVEALRKLGPSDVRTITGAIGKPENAIRILLSRMVDSGVIERPSRGLYAVASTDLSH